MICAICKQKIDSSNTLAQNGETSAWNAYRGPHSDVLPEGSILCDVCLGVGEFDKRRFARYAIWDETREVKP